MLLLLPLPLLAGHIAVVVVVVATVVILPSMAAARLRRLRAAFDIAGARRFWAALGIVPECVRRQQARWEEKMRVKGACMSPRSSPLLAQKQKF
jgi:hypothetical protein